MGQEIRWIKVRKYHSCAEASGVKFRLSQNLGELMVEVCKTIEKVIALVKGQNNVMEDQWMMGVVARVVATMNSVKMEDQSLLWKDLNPADNQEGGFLSF